MNKILEMLLANLKQPSTYRGMGMIAIALGAPQGTLDHFVQVGIFIVGILGLIPDHFFTDLFAGKKIDTAALITEIVQAEITKSQTTTPAEEKPVTE